MNCKTAKKKIDFFFLGAGTPTEKREEVLNDVLYKHLTVGSTVRKHNVSCQLCWDYYQGMKQQHCGG